MFLDNYKSLLGSSAQDNLDMGPEIMAMGKTLTIEQQLSLTQPFNGHDGRRAIFSIDQNKSPGPNGYGTVFFKDTWHIVEDDITQAILQFFSNELLLKQVNATIL